MSENEIETSFVSVAIVWVFPTAPSRTPAEQRNPLQSTWERSIDDDVDSEAEDANLWCHYPHGRSKVVVLLL